MARTGTRRRNTTCQRCQKDFIGFNQMFCPDCRWWIKYWREVDAPKGIMWNYLEDKYYVDDKNRVLPDKYLKEVILQTKKSR
jgi:hypothetical protein